MRALLGGVGLALGALIDLVVNLIASVIQDEAGQGILDRSLWLLVALAAVGLLAGVWLAGHAGGTTSATTEPDAVHLSRVHAWRSTFKTRGRGIHLDRICSRDSEFDIRTDDGDADD